jgi:hypothetical protein
MYFNLASGAGTGSIVITGNSIESFTDTGIFISSVTNTPVLGTLSKFVISGNEIGGFGNSTCIKASNSSTPTWFKGLTISSNVIANCIDGTGTTAQGINLDYLQNVTIVGNTIRNEFSAGSTTGIVLGSNASIVSKVGNSITGYNTAISDSSTSPQTETLKGGLTVLGTSTLAATTATTIDASSTVTTTDQFRARAASPAFWLDETDSTTKGALTVLDGGIYQVQRRATNFGAFEATVTSLDISTGAVSQVGSFRALNATATPAGGTAGSGLMMGSTTNLGIFFGSGAPSLSAAQGSLYIRSDGSSTSTRLYVNTNGTTGWTNVTTAA